MKNFIRRIQILGLHKKFILFDFQQDFTNFAEHANGIIAKRIYLSKKYEQLEFLLFVY
jgi:hypothetical protein